MALHRSPFRQQECANHYAAQLLDALTAAKPAPDGFQPGLGLLDGSDILKPHGQFMHALRDPGVWSDDSQNALSQAAKDHEALANRHELAAENSKDQWKTVFETWCGYGADAAHEHYIGQYGAQLAVVAVAEVGSNMFGQFGEDVQRTKRVIREAHDDADGKIEDYPNSPGGKPLNTVGAVIAEYRPLIQGSAAELAGSSARQVAMLSDKFGIVEAPPLSKDTDPGTHGSDSSTADPHKKPEETGAHGDRTG